MQFGEYLKNKGILNQDQIEAVLKKQSESKDKEKKMFGDIAVELGFITKDNVENEFLNYCKND